MKEAFLKHVDEFKDLLAKSPEADKEAMKQDFTQFLLNFSKKERPFIGLVFQLEDKYPYFILRKNIARLLTPVPYEEKKDALAIATEHGAFTRTFNDHSSPVDWLQNVLKLITRGDGTVQIKQEGKIAFIQINANVLPIHYAAHAFLASLSSETPGVLDNPEIKESIFKVDLAKARKARYDHQQLQSCGAWLEKQGFKVNTGYKECGNELFVNVKSVENRNDTAVRFQCGISLKVAEKLLTYNDYPAVFPATIQVEAEGKQRSQLEFYFKDAQLKGANGEEKTFILDEFGVKTKKCNISQQQALQLLPYIQRLDMLSRRQNLPLTALSDEDEVGKTQRNIRYQSLKLLKETNLRSHVNTLAWRPNNESAMPAQSYLEVESLNTPTGLSRAGSRYFSETEFEQKFEKYVNETYILGPEAFKLLFKTPLSALSSGVNNLQVALRANENLSKTEKEACLTKLEKAPETALISYHQDFKPNTSSSRHDLPEYFLALAQIIAPQLMKSDCIDNVRVQELKKVAVKDLANRLDEIRSFFEKHTSYYFVKQLAGVITNLMDTPQLPEEAIPTILAEFGVGESSLKFYKMKGMELFNRYHIKFDALLLAYDVCINRGILLDFKNEKNNRNQWVFNPHDDCFAHDILTGVRRALEFQVYAVYKPEGWGVTNGTQNYNTQSHSSQENGKTTYTAGSDTFFAKRNPINTSTSNTYTGSSIPNFSYSSGG